MNIQTKGLHFTFKEKVYFFPSDYAFSLILAIELQNLESLPSNIQYRSYLIMQLFW